MIIRIFLIIGQVHRPTSNTACHDTMRNAFEGVSMRMGLRLSALRVGRALLSKFSTHPITGNPSHKWGLVLDLPKLHEF